MLHQYQGSSKGRVERTYELLVQLDCCRWREPKQLNEPEGCTEIDEVSAWQGAEQRRLKASKTTMSATPLLTGARL